MLKTRGVLTHNFALTRQCNRLVLLVSYRRKWQSGYAVGLKPAHGGSIPPFLVSLFVLGQMLVPQMCGKVGGTRVVILRWSKLIRLMLPLVWQQKPLRE